VASTVFDDKATATRTPAPRRRISASTLAARALVVVVYLFILSPLAFVVWLSFFKDVVITFPPSGYTAAWYVNAWRNAAFADGFIFSVKIALCAAVIGVSLGVAAALGIARYRFMGGSLVNMLLLSPLVVPGIVAGVAVCLTIPWTMRLVSAAMSGLDTTIEEAARNLGATGFQTFWRVTLPMLRPAIVASALFSFIISFENLELTLPLVGPGHTTLPIAIMQYLEFNLDPTIAAVSAVQIVLLGIVMLVTDRFVKLSQVI
jgi:putative spermidine/putrescine transport system permease protein